MGRQPVWPTTPPTRSAGHRIRSRRTLCGTAPGGATTYTFDSDGNELGNSSGLNLAYNARNQTSSITSGGTANPLGYLGQGQGALTAIGSTSILNNLLGLSGQASSGSTTYDTRDVSGNLLAERTPSGTDTYLHDGLASIVGVTSGTGTGLNTAAYDPYGQTAASTGSTPNPFTYASGLATPGGLIKYGYYDPAIGRWTQQDPLLQPDDPGSANGYLYAGDDPISATDPSGLCPLDLGLTPTLIFSPAGEYVAKCRKGVTVGYAFYPAPKGTSQGAQIKHASNSLGCRTLLAVGVGADFFAVGFGFTAIFTAPIPPLSGAMFVGSAISGHRRGSVRSWPRTIM